MDYRLASFVARARRRRRVLESLLEGPKLPKQIARDSKTSASNIYRALRELERAGLISCETPEAYTCKFYSITEKGKQIIGFLTK